MAKSKQVSVRSLRQGQTVYRVENLEKDPVPVFLASNADVECARIHIIIFRVPFFITKSAAKRYSARLLLEYHDVLVEWGAAYRQMAEELKNVQYASAGTPAVLASEVDGDGCS